MRGGGVRVLEKITEGGFKPHTPPPDQPLHIYLHLCHKGYRGGDVQSGLYAYRTLLGCDAIKELLERVWMGQAIDAVHMYIAVVFTPGW